MVAAVVLLILGLLGALFGVFLPTLIMALIGFIVFSFFGIFFLVPVLLILWVVALFMKFKKKRDIFYRYDWNSWRDKKFSYRSSNRSNVFEGSYEDSDDAVKK